MRTVSRLDKQVGALFDLHHLTNERIDCLVEMIKSNSNCIEILRSVLDEKVDKQGIGKGYEKTYFD